MRLLLATIVSALMLCAGARAQTPPANPPPPAASPADKELMDDMAKMNAGMNVAMTGDPDRDFVAMMLAHHQGAVEMAHTELHYGKDEQLRALARQIIAAQDKEIAFMRRWQTKHGEKHAQ